MKIPAQLLDPTNGARRCPHCQHDLTVKEAIVILNGSGFVQKVRVRVPETGVEAWVDAAQVNPRKVEILERHTPPAPRHSP
jgi:hypothetical protein